MADLTTLLSTFLRSLPLFSGAASGVIKVDTTTAGTPASTDETALWSYSLPANTLDVNGRGVRVTAFGTNAANGNTKVVRGYFGGTSFVAQNAAANGTFWRVTYDVIRVSATTQVLSGVPFVSTGLGAATTFSAPTETLSGAVVIKVTGANGTANANDIVFRGAIVELIN